MNKVKSIIIVVLSLGIFIGSLHPIVNVKKTQAAYNAGLSCSNLTILKGQYTCIGAIGYGSSPEMKWSSSNNCIKVSKRNGSICYIKGLNVGTAYLQFMFRAVSFKCKVKVVGSDKFLGDYTDGETSLFLTKNGSTYDATIGMYRFCEMHNLKGRVKNEVLTLKGKDPGNKNIVLAVKRSGKNCVISIKKTAKKTTWQYFSVGQKFKLKKVKSVMSPWMEQPEWE